jgi:hypothetical protein
MMYRQTPEKMLFPAPPRVVGEDDKLSIGIVGPNNVNRSRKVLFIIDDIEIGIADIITPPDLNGTPATPR